MAFLRLPTKRDALPATPTPKVVPKGTPRVVPNRPAPGPTTVAEGPKRRMLGLGTMRVGQQYTILGAVFAVLFAAAGVRFQDNRGYVRYGVCVHVGPNAHVEPAHCQGGADGTDRQP
jgi:hypothetical protein